MNRIRRLLVLLPASTLAIGASLTAGPLPSLAATPFRIVADLGGCFTAHDPEFGDLDVTWTDAKGHTKVHFTTSAHEYGWSPPITVCQRHSIAVGDVIHVHETSPDDVTHQFRIPNVAGTFDRTTNIVTGRTPITGDVAIVVGRPDLGRGAIPKTCIFTPVRDSAGNIQVDTTDCAPGFDAIGGDVAVLEWANPAGDGVRDFVRSPYVEALVGTTQVDGYLDAGTSVALTLRSSARSVRASATAHADPVTGAFTATFENVGHHLVTVHPGDFVQGSWAGPRSVQVKRMSIDTTSTPNAVNASCSPNTSYGLSVARSGKTGFFESGTTDATGKATPLDVSSSPLTTGDVVTFTCMRPNGDRTRLDKTVA